jgi:hypothetical protein
VNGKNVCPRDHSLESSGGALSDGSISFLIQLFGGGIKPQSLKRSLQPAGCKLAFSFDVPKESFFVFCMNSLDGKVQIQIVTVKFSMDGLGLKASKCDIKKSKIGNTSFSVP